MDEVERYIELPSDFRPSSSWIYSGLEVLVDVAPYTGMYKAGGKDMRWCSFERVAAAGSLSVFPVKAQVPGRGIGQWKFSEVQGWRYEASTLAALSELHRSIGADLPPGIDAEWLERALAGEAS